jgi:hypothetical protein
VDRADTGSTACVDLYWFAHRGAAEHVAQMNR